MYTQITEGRLALSGQDRTLRIINWGKKCGSSLTMLQNLARWLRILLSLLVLSLLHKPYVSQTRYSGVRLRYMPLHGFYSLTFNFGPIGSSQCGLCSFFLMQFFMDVSLQVPF